MLRTVGCNNIKLIMTLNNLAKRKHINGEEKRANKIPLGGHHSFVVEEVALARNVRLESWYDRRLRTEPKFLGHLQETGILN